MSLDDLAAAAHPQRTHRTAPSYPEILTGAKVLRTIAAIWIFLGILALIGGAALTAWGFMRGERDTAGLGGILLLSGLSNVVLALLVKMNASLALAVRDIARNSFR